MYNLIVLGAGKGSRMKYLTTLVPKPLIKFQRFKLLEYILRCADLNYIKKITVIAGYKSDKFAEYDTKIIINDFFEKFNSLYSFYLGLINSTEDVIFSYGDIIYQPSVLTRLMHVESPFVVVIDVNYKDYWLMRMDNPLDDLETCKIDKFDYLQEIGLKADDYHKIDGQYIGLFKINKTQIDKVISAINMFCNEKGVDLAYGSSITPFLNWCIQKSLIQFKVLKINGGWLEFDSPEDLNLYNSMVKNKTIEKLIILDEFSK